MSIETIILPKSREQFDDMFLKKSKSKNFF